VDEIDRRIDQLAELMEEFQLSEARLEGENWRVAFRHGGKPAAPTDASPSEIAERLATHAAVPLESPVSVEEGEPVTSPMAGIYYAQPSPSAPPFVRVGDEVEEGQVLALIEAMKVFNELVAPFSGRVTNIAVTNGSLIQSGDPILYLLPAD
jgi:acetyl-CoA carboxylase biotin carboxyl carrier protein